MRASRRPAYERPCSRLWPLPSRAQFPLSSAGSRLAAARHERRREPRSISANISPVSKSRIHDHDNAVVYVIDLLSEAL